MEFDRFKEQIRNSIPVGTKLKNPSRGISTISSYSSSKISYVRGSSTIDVTFRDLFDAYHYFRGKKVMSSALKKYAPSVFDSASRPAGHSCNCTFLFLVLQQLGVAENIGGKGVKGDPYFVEIEG